MPVERAHRFTSILLILLPESARIFSDLKQVGTCLCTGPFEIKKKKKHLTKMHSCSSCRQEEISYFHRLTIQAASPWWLRWSRIWLQYRRPRFNPWVGKIPWRRKWQPTPVFLPGKSHGQWSLGGYSPWGFKESDRTERLTHTHTHTHTHTRT